MPPVGSTTRAVRRTLGAIGLVDRDRAAPAPAFLSSVNDAMAAQQREPPRPAASRASVRSCAASGDARCPRRCGSAAGSCRCHLWQPRSTQFTAGMNPEPAGDLASHGPRRASARRSRAHGRHAGSAQLAKADPVAQRDLGESSAHVPLQRRVHQRHAAQAHSAGPPSHLWVSRSFTSHAPPGTQALQRRHQPGQAPADDQHIRLHHASHVVLPCSLRHLRRTAPRTWLHSVIAARSTCGPWRFLHDRAGAGRVCRAPTIRYDASPHGNPAKDMNTPDAVAGWLPLIGRGRWFTALPPGRQQALLQAGHRAADSGRGPVVPAWRRQFRPVLRAPKAPSRRRRQRQRARKPPSRCWRHRSGSGEIAF